MSSSSPRALRDLVEQVQRRVETARRARVAVRVASGGLLAAVLVAMLGGAIVDGGAPSRAAAGLGGAALIVAASVLLAPRRPDRDAFERAALRIDRRLGAADLIATAVSDARSPFAALVIARATAAVRDAGDAARPERIVEAIVPAETAPVACAVALLGAAALAFPSAPAQNVAPIVEVGVDWRSGGGGAAGGVADASAGAAGPGGGGERRDDGAGGAAGGDAMPAEAAAELLEALRDGRVRLVSAAAQAERLRAALAEADPADLDPGAPGAVAASAEERAALRAALADVLRRALAAGALPAASGSSGGEADSAADPDESGAGGGGPGDGATTVADGAGEVDPNNPSTTDVSTNTGAASSGRGARDALPPRLARVVSIYFEGENHR